MTLCTHVVPSISRIVSAVQFCCHDRLRNAMCTVIMKFCCAFVCKLYMESFVIQMEIPLPK